MTIASFLDPFQLLQASGQQIGSALAGAVATALLGYMARLRRKAGQKQITAAITRFTYGDYPTAIIGSPLKAQPGTKNLTNDKDGLPLFGYGPLCAYALISNHLIDSGWASASTDKDSLPNIVVSSDWDHLPEQLKRNTDLIVLGWSSGNEAAKALEPLMELPVVYHSEERSLLARSDGGVVATVKYESKPDGDRLVTSDFGLLVRTRHPLNSKRSVLYLSGGDTFGVKIAAEALETQLLLKAFSFGSLIGYTWRHPWIPTIGLSRIRDVDFAIVVKANVHSLTTGIPDVVEVWTKDSLQPNAIWKKTGTKGEQIT